MESYLYCGLFFVAGATFGLGLLWVFRAWKGDNKDDPAELRRRMLSGSYQILEGNWKKAIESFSAIARADAKQQDVYFILGRLFRKLGDFTRAAQIHRSLMVRHDGESSEQKIHAMFELGEDYLAAGGIDISIGIFDDLLENSPGNHEAREKLATLHAMRGDWEKASGYLAELAKGGDKGKRAAARFYAQRAIMLLDEGDVANAKKPVRRALSLDPGHPHILAAQAGFLAASGKAKKAFEAMDKALSKAPVATAYLLDSYRRLAVELDREDVFDELLIQRLDAKAYMPHITRLQQAIRMIERGEDVEARLIIESLLAENGRDPYVLSVAVDLGLLPKISGEAAFSCARCGITQAKPGWFCSACGGWDTFFDTTSN